MVKKRSIKSYTLNSKLKLTLYKIFGFALLGLAFLGVFIPLLPTTPLVLLALYCFKRAAPHWEEWILAHPWVGPPVSRWRKEKTIAMQVKLLALAMMAASFGLSIWTLYPNPLCGFLAIIWLTLTIIVCRIKTTSV